MKEQRLDILRKLRANTISPNEAEKQLCDLFIVSISYSFEGIEKKCEREQKEAFINYMDFDRISFGKGASYVIGRLKKRWLN
jgi:hypothetical protein